MKKILLIVLLIFTIAISIYFAQKSTTRNNQQEPIYTLIENYNQSRETGDTALLNNILTHDIDQLVSSGEWRIGLEAATKGMMSSSTNNPGKRTITINKIRFVNPETAIVDAKYEIQNSDDSERKMWSTFIVIYKENSWKITAIRNMLPSK